MRVYDTRPRVSQSAWLAFSVVLFLALILFSSSGSPAHAQDEGANRAQDGQQDAAKADQPIATRARPNLLKHIVTSAGIFFGPLLLMVSIGLVALIVLLSMDLRLPTAIPPAFVDEFTVKCFAPAQFSA